MGAKQLAGVCLRILIDHAAELAQGALITAELWGLCIREPLGQP